MTTLIQRAEQAATREEAVAVFREYFHEHGLDYVALGQSAPPKNFVWFFEDAAASSDDERALGYLLLAAMAVAPEGCWYRLEEGGTKPNGAPYGPVAQLAHKVKTEFGWGVAFRGYSNAHFPCTALLAAILKTEATNG